MKREIVSGKKYQVAGIKYQVQNWVGERVWGIIGELNKGDLADGGVLVG
jgi:hypothetical protein